METQPPWSTAEPHDQRFVLITGANSGVGLGIAQRLIDEFLLQRPSSCQLILITTTRSVPKSRSTILALRRHLERTARSPSLRQRVKARCGHELEPASCVSRVHLLSTEVDLCNLTAIYEIASRLVDGHITNPNDIPTTDHRYPAYSRVKVPRLDSVILNAGIGGWSSLDWLGMTSMLFRAGFVETTTWPDYKIAPVGRKIPPIHHGYDNNNNKSCTDAPDVGEIFMANVFGHYMLIHHIMSLLTRSPNESPEIPPCRIIWQSSIEAFDNHFELADIQGIRTSDPYESSKRLTDLLALTCDLPSVRAQNLGFFTHPRVTGNQSRHATIRPRMYVAHPGIVVTTIFPLHWILFFWYRLAMYVARLMGSPWHVVTAYTGAISCVWLALEDSTVLSSLLAERSKWGSACDKAGRPFCKRTEVQGWGWEGRAGDENDNETGILRNSIGRRSGSKNPTTEDIYEFEELGAACWMEMERLRLQLEETCGPENVPQLSSTA